MDKQEFRNRLIGLFPEFCHYWEAEDVHREDDGSLSAHGLMSSFFLFYQDKYSSFNPVIVSELAGIFEEIVESDPNDQSDVANAICTSFLELVDENREGKVLEKHLGRECEAFLRAMRGFS
jgi:hypothetical protein